MPRLLALLAFMLCLACGQIVVADPSGALPGPLPAGGTPATPAAVPDQTKLPKNSSIYRLVVNSFWEVNCYIISGETGKAIVIDPGDELEHLDSGQYRPTGAHAKLIYDTLVAKKLTLKYIVLTHGHLDHIGAIGYLKEKTGATIIMHADDVHGGYAKDTHMFEGGLPKVDRTVKDGEIISLDGIVLQVIHTPGHSPGSICLRTRKGGATYLFTGDTLLYHSVGRTNFHDGSGNEELLFRSIREKLFTLPEDTLVFPGHYQFSTIGEEKANNPFLNAPPLVENDDPLVVSPAVPVTPASPDAGPTK